MGITCNLVMRSSPGVCGGVWLSGCDVEVVYRGVVVRREVCGCILTGKVVCSGMVKLRWGRMVWVCGGWAVW